jgi:hypothetical protein
MGVNRLLTPRRPSAIFTLPAAGNSARGRFVDTVPRFFRRLAQLVEHHLHTVGVNGSSPLAPTNRHPTKRRPVERPGGVFVLCIITLVLASV